MKNLTGKINKLWAQRMRYDYLEARGVFLGWEQWHGTHSKVYLVHKLLHLEQYDIIVSLDADAVVTADYWDVERQLLDLGSPLVAGPAVRGRDFPAWELNAGVTLWNTKHRYAREVITKWFQRSKENIGIRGDDQSELHYQLREKLQELTDGDADNFSKAMSLHPLLSAVMPNKKYRQFLRAGVGAGAEDWTGDSVEARVASVLDYQRRGWP